MSFIWYPFIELLFDFNHDVILGIKFLEFVYFREPQAVVGSIWTSATDFWK